MNKKEFAEKWVGIDSTSGFRIIRFNGGLMYVNMMSINQVTVKREGKSDVVYDEVQLSIVVGGIWIEIGTIRLDKITEVL